MPEDEGFDTGSGWQDSYEGDECPDIEDGLCRATIEDDIVLVQCRNGEDTLQIAMTAESARSLARQLNECAEILVPLDSE